MQVCLQCLSMPLWLQRHDVFVHATVVINFSLSLFPPSSCVSAVYMSCVLLNILIWQWAFSLSFSLIQYYNCWRQAEWRNAKIRREQTEKQFTVYSSRTQSWAKYTCCSSGLPADRSCYQRDWKEWPCLLCTAAAFRFSSIASEQAIPLSVGNTFCSHSKVFWRTGKTGLLRLKNNFQKASISIIPNFVTGWKNGRNLLWRCWYACQCGVNLSSEMWCMCLPLTTHLHHKITQKCTI